MSQLWNEVAKINVYLNVIIKFKWDEPQLLKYNAFINENFIQSILVMFTQTLPLTPSKSTPTSLPPQLCIILFFK